VFFWWVFKGIIFYSIKPLTYRPLVLSNHDQITFSDIERVYYWASDNTVSNDRGFQMATGIILFNYSWLKSASTKVSFASGYQILRIICFHV
jgi:hypothetical protein